jgi:hypothetical protein
MLKNIYIVTKHSYWEHYNAKPQKTEYETKEEALKAANDYESRWFMEDGYYATVHTEKRLIITPEDERKREERRLLKKETFNYRKDAYAYGIYTFWDGTKDIFFVILEDDGTKSICFVHDKVKYTLASHLDYFKFKLDGKWCIGSNESMVILGGLLERLPESCQKIRTVSLEYFNEEMILDLFF